jgi:hypothetical protein
MRKRNIQIITRLNENEYEHFKKCVKRSTLSQEGFMRNLINGLVAPNQLPLDFHKMTSELRAIGNNINQIARKANALNIIDAKRFDEALAQHRKAYLSIIETISEHRKIEIWQPPQLSQKRKKGECKND